MYTNLTIERFRGINHLEIQDIKRINLFIGKNNCGKTTILEAIFLLTGAVNPELALRVNAFRHFNIIDENSWSLFFNKLDLQSDIRISAKLAYPIQTRELTIKPQKASSVAIDSTIIQKEQIDLKAGYTAPSPGLNGLILEYSTTDQNQNRKTLTSQISQQGPGLQIRIPKEYKDALPGVFLNPETTALDLEKRFNKIQINKQIDSIISVLKQVEPKLHNLSLGSGGIIYCDIGLDRLLPAQLLGNGLFRLLSIISAISDIENGILLIDEIENGFYYSSQHLLWNTILTSARKFNVQVFLTTHSLECIKALVSSYSSHLQIADDLRLYRINRENDNLEAVTYDFKTLQASLDSDWEVR
jgi:AAA15 family ATPase/GTPase